MDQDHSLSPSQLAALEQLLAGASVKQSASAAGVDRTTVHRWLREDLAFGAAHNRARSELRGEIELKLLALAGRSIETVAKALDDTDQRVTMAILKGLGFLPGEARPIGPGAPEEQQKERALERKRAERMRELELLVL